MEQSKRTRIVLTISWPRDKTLYDSYRNDEYRSLREAQRGLRSVLGKNLIFDSEYAWSEDRKVRVRVSGDAVIADFIPAAG